GTVVDRLEEAEEAPPLVEHPVVFVIDDGRDPPADLAPPKGQERLYLGFLVEGMRPVTQQFPLVLPQGRHPVRVVVIQLPGEVDKAPAVAPRAYRLDHNVGHAASSQLDP